MRSESREGMKLRPRPLLLVVQVPSGQCGPMVTTSILIPGLGRRLQPNPRGNVMIS